MDKSKSQNIAQGLIQYLKKASSLDLLPDILSELGKSLNLTKTTAQVTSGIGLSIKQQKEIEEIIVANFGINKIDFEIDGSLLAGIKVKIGDQIVDLSLKNKINHLAKSI